MGGFCRLCALEKNNLVGIYEDEGHRLSIELKIKKCLNIELAEKENLPKRVCLECCTKLDAFDEFIENSLNAQNTLCLLFAESPGRDDVITGTSIDNEFKVLETSQDYDDDHGDILCEGKLEEKLIGGHEFEESILVEDAKVVPGKVNSIPKCKQDSKSENDEASDFEGDGVQRNSNWDPQTWFCSDCSEGFQSVEELKQHHEGEHKQNVRYMCGLCSKQFLVYGGFIAHLRRHKNGVRYICDECGKEFSNKKVLDSHRTTHSDSRPFACEQCGKAFRLQSALYIHMRCHLPDDVKNKFQCDQCNKRFSTKPNLVTHKRIHTGVRNFTCDQCGKSFIQKGNLDAHLITHSHDKPFSCEICSKRFKTGMQLRKHHSVHTGAKPHQCDVCGRTFRERGTLREHHRIHTGAMPFTCEYCGKAFRFKGILTTHRRQHTGERPYSCLECQHHFTNWPNYNKHMKRRHGINTSRSTRAPLKPPQGQPSSAQPPQQQATQLFQDIQPDLYTNIQAQAIGPGLATYIPYNIYSSSLPQVTIDPTATIEMLQR